MLSHPLHRLALLIIPGMLSACGTFPETPITLASGPVKSYAPSPATLALPVITTSASIPRADAIRLLNVQSNQFLNELRSPAIKNISDTIQQTEAQNEYYQAFAIIIATAAPFTTGLHFAQRALISIIGGFVTYKSTKGSPVSQNNECKTLNATIASVQQFDTKWTLTFSAEDPVLIKDFKNMQDDANTLSGSVTESVNGCMNPYWTAGKTPSS